MKSFQHWLSTYDRVPKLYYLKVRKIYDKNIFRLRQHQPIFSNFSAKYQSSYPYCRRGPIDQYNESCPGIGVKGIIEAQIISKTPGPYRISTKRHHWCSFFVLSPHQYSSRQQSSYQNSEKFMKFLLESFLHSNR